MMVLDGVWLIEARVTKFIHFLLLYLSILSRVAMLMDESIFHLGQNFGGGRE